MRGLEVETKPPHRVPIRTVVALSEPILPMGHRARIFAAVGDVVADSDTEVGSVIRLEKMLSVEFLKEYQKAWTKEFKDLISYSGKSRVSLGDFIRIGSLFARDGGRRAAALTLKMKYASSFSDPSWPLWLSEEFRATDPGSHVGMLLINESGKYELDRLWSEAERHHSEQMTMLLQLGQIRKQDKQKALKDRAKRLPFREVKQITKTIHKGQEYLGEVGFLSAWSEVKRQKARTETM